jgi:hypothetical protein
MADGRTGRTRADVPLAEIAAAMKNSFSSKISRALMFLNCQHSSTIRQSLMLVNERCVCYVTI